MARPKKSNTNKYKYEDFWLTTDIYKQKVVSFFIRLDYKKDNDKAELIDISSLRNSVEIMFNNEFEFVQRKRHFIYTEMSDYLRYTSGHLQLECHFMKEVLENTPYDSYDDYIIEHTTKLIQELRQLFKEHNLTIIAPQRCTKKQCTER